MEVDSWLAVLKEFGWPGVILVVLLFILYRHAPRLIDAQVDLTNTANESIKEHSKSLNSIRETLVNMQALIQEHNATLYNQHQRSTRTNAGIIILSDMIMLLASSHSPEVKDVVKRHADNLNRLFDN